MQNTRYRASTTLVLSVAAALLAATVLACEQPRSSARPSASLVEIDVSRAPSTPTAEPSVTAAPQPTFVEIPVGWDNSFCGILADAVLAQELVIDVERALDEENARDARLLARELRDVTADATSLLSQVPAWDTGAQAIQRLGVMIDLGSRAAEQYDIAFDQGSAGALRHARGLRRDLRSETAATNEALTNMANLGISCDATPMQLEAF